MLTSIRRALMGMVAGGIVLAASSAAFAIPSLQLGPGTGTWTYDTSTNTWVTQDNPFNIIATANSDTSGANGDYAWDSAGSSTQYGYLVLAAASPTATDGFDVTVNGDSGALTLVSSGYGTPPLNDPNSLAPHGIYDSWFEVYEFQFDGSVQTICDTQPGQTSNCGDGFKEAFDIIVNSLAAGVTGIHMDLFTVTGAQWDPTAPADKQIVNAFAPFSHDADYGNVPHVPEPASSAALGIGLLGLAAIRRRWRKRA